MNIKDFIARQNYTMNVYKRRTGEVYRILGDDTNIVKKFVIREDIETPLVECDITIRTSPETFNIIEAGDIITYYANELTLEENVEFKRKHVFHVLRVNDRDQDFDKVAVCRNGGYWLMRNAFYLKINQDETTSQFIERTCREKGIPIDYIEPTTYKHQAQVFPKSSLNDAWYNTMILNSFQESLLYNIRYTPLGVVFERIEDNVKVWSFEAEGNYGNIINPSRSVSIMDPIFTNIIRVVRPDQEDQEGSTPTLAHLGTVSDDIYEEYSNQQSVDLFGEFPTEINVENYGDPEELADKLQDIVNNAFPLDSFSFTTYAINSIRPSSRILINYRNTESFGLYFINSLVTTVRDKESWHEISAIKRRDVQSGLIDELTATSGAGETDELAFLNINVPLSAIQQ